MPLIMPILLSILSALPGQLGGFFKGRQDVQKAQIDNALLLEQERSKLIAQGMISQSELGKTQIAATSAKFKEIVYFLMLAPIIVTCFNPELGSRIFNSLNIVPDWYVGLIVTIGLAMWGIGSDRVKDIIQARREYSLQKGALTLNRKMFYETLRSVKGPIGQNEVTLYEKALDSLSK